MQRDSSNLIPELKRSSNVVIYGAGRIGRLLQKQLVQVNITISEFWDKNADIITDIDETEVVLPRLNDSTLNKDTTVVIIAVIDSQISLTIKKILDTSGFKNVIYGKASLFKILNTICSLQIQNNPESFNCRKCDSCVAHIDKDFHCAISDDYFISTFTDKKVSPQNERVILPTLSLIITNRCNLRCEGCNHLQDQYTGQKKSDIPTETLLHDLRKVVDSVDVVRRLLIVGGETFLHKEFADLLTKISSLKGIGLIDIITNGTIAPQSDDIFEQLSHERFHVTISDYNAEDNLKASLLKNREKLIKKLQQYSISYDLNTTIEWYDLGNYENRHYDEKQRKEIFKTCCFITNDMFDGTLYKCSRNAFSTFLGKIPNDNTGFIDVRNSNNSIELRSQITQFLAIEDLSGCQYCNGNFGKRIPAGIQATS